MNYPELFSRIILVLIALGILAAILHKLKVI